MVRVAGLAALVRKGVSSLSADGMTPAEQLQAVNDASSELQDEQQIIWRNLQRSWPRRASTWCKWRTSTRRTWCSCGSASWRTCGRS
jgi:polyphosphate kinase